MPPALTRNLWFVILSSLVGGTYFNIIMPLGGLALTEREMPSWQIGLLGALPWLFIVMGVPEVPRLAARVGAVRLYRGAGWVLVAASLLFALSDNLVLWGLGYGLCGLVAAVRWIIGDAILTTVPPPEDRPKWIGLYMFLINFILIIGPLFVVMLGTGKITFWAGVLVAIVSALLSYFVHLPDRLAIEEAHQGNGWANLLMVAKRVPLLMLLPLVAGCIEGANIKMLPVQTFNLGYEEGLAALSATVAGAGNLVSQLLLIKLSGRVNQRHLSLALVGAILFASLLLPFTAAHIVLFMACLFIIGGAAGAIYTLAVLEVGRLAAPAEAPHMIAGIALTYTSGAILGPALVGGGMSVSLVWGLPMIYATLVLAAGFVLWRKRPDPAKN